MLGVAELSLPRRSGGFGGCHPQSQQQQQQHCARSSPRASASYCCALPRSTSSSSPLRGPRFLLNSRPLLTPSCSASSPSSHPLLSISISEKVSLRASERLSARVTSLHSVDTSIDMDTETGTLQELLDEVCDEGMVCEVHSGTPPQDADVNHPIASPGHTSDLATSLDLEAFQLLAGYSAGCSAAAQHLESTTADVSGAGRGNLDSLPNSPTSATTPDVLTVLHGDNPPSISSRTTSIPALSASEGDYPPSCSSSTATSAGLQLPSIGINIPMPNFAAFPSISSAIRAFKDALPGHTAPPPGSAPAKDANSKSLGGLQTEGSGSEMKTGGLLVILSILSISYVHQATTGFALPAMLPMISLEMGLTDIQGALLTTGFSYLYAAALLPVGIMADKVNRPMLLGAGLALWSTLTIVASGARNFNELIAARVGFAAAQAVQNPICFSLIPELFPKNKSLALAAYNCAIYVGRGLSLGAVILAHSMSTEGINGIVEFPADIITTAAGHIWVPLDKVDLHLVSIVYTAGDMVAVAVTPHYNYWMSLDEFAPAGTLDSVVNNGAWRDVLRVVALPGFGIAALVALFVKDPRDERAKRVAEEKAKRLAEEAAESGPHPGLSPDAWLGPPNPTSDSSEPSPATAIVQSLPSAVLDKALLLASPTSIPHVLLDRLPFTSEASSSSSSSPSSASLDTVLRGSVPQWTETAAPEEEKAKEDNGMANVWTLLQNKPFLATTIAASLNDLSSYALIAWQSTFYERVYHIESSVYAPILAAVLPIGGIIGGVGGGFIADRLAKRGKRAWVTAGASLLAAPFLLESIIAENYETSLFALMIGFALSEAWRAPSAVMAKSCAPSGMGATSSALYLCVRNLVGGLGPLFVAVMSSRIGLQSALFVVPAATVASGAVFLFAEKMFNEKDRRILLDQSLQDSMDEAEEMAAATVAAEAARMMDVNSQDSTQLDAEEEEKRKELIREGLEKSRIALISTTVPSSDH